MSKQDNLTDFLTDVADAIREKKCTTEKINPQNFSDEIRSIEGGGGSPTWNIPEEKDVNFFDYDGTLLYSYTWDEAVALTEFPTPPNLHKGLVFAGWNYSIEDMLAQQGKAWIGALYKTVNSRTRLIVEGQSRYTTIITLSSKIPSIIDVYWGDGQIERFNVIGLVYCEHEYISNHNIIEIDVISGLVSFGTGSSVIQKEDYTCIEINMGENISIEVAGLRSFYHLNKISLHNNIPIIGTSILSQESTLDALILPNNINYSNERIITVFKKVGLYIPPRKFANLTSLFNENQYKFKMFLSDLVDLQTITLNSASIFRNLNITTSPAITSNIHTVVIGNKIIIIDSNFDIPEGITSINDYASWYRISDRNNVIIPDSITEIGKGGLFTSNNINIKLSKSLNIIGLSGTKPNVIDARNCESIPTLSATNSISGALHIIVPDSLKETWINSTNWTSYKQIIYSASESPVIVKDNIVYNDYADFINNGYISANNVGDIQTYNVTSSNGWYHNVIDVENYDVVEISGEGGNSPRLFTLIDSEGIVRFNAPSSFIINNVTVDLSNIKYLIVNTSTTRRDIKKIIKLGNYVK